MFPTVSALTSVKAVEINKTDKLCLFTFEMQIFHFMPHLYSRAEGRWKMCWIPINRDPFVCTLTSNYNCAKKDNALVSLEEQENRELFQYDQQ